MEDRFFRYWFKGFAEGLERIPARERGILLQGCAEACSRSYTLGVYQEAWAKSATLEGFLKSLNAVFPELDYTLSEDHKTVTITYDHCACDLYTKGLIKSPRLCECSLRSITYNWEAVMGEGNVDVEMKGSILKGDTECVFAINLK